MINRSGNSLQTSDLQFAYKNNHSTTMCSVMNKETVQYYMNNESNVHGCMLDASKAFDRIRFDKLFSVLLERDFSAPYIRFLLNGYLAQTIRVKWGSSTSKPFKGTNGVRQGGVISPILFTIYMERNRQITNQ